MIKNLSLLNEDLDDVVELEYDISDLQLSDSERLSGTVTITKSEQEIIEDVILNCVIENDDLPSTVSGVDEEALYSYINDNFDELFSKYEKEVYDHYREYATDEVYDNFSDYEYTEEDYWADWADDNRDDF